MPEEPALAGLVRSGDQQTRADDIASGIFGIRDISNAYLVTTSDGDVMVNTGFMDNAARNHALLAPHRTGPLRTIVLTQSHADHFGGVETFREETSRILAGAGFSANWADMKRLQPFFGPRTRKLWGSVLKRGASPAMPPDVEPDLEIDGLHRFELGARTFEILPTPEGETTDGITVWLPVERIAFVGNLFGPAWMSMPFLNTLRGDKPRSVRQFLASADRVRRLEPEVLVTGHGEPICGAGRIRRDLDTLIAAVTFIRDGTLDGMNAGCSVEELMQTVKLPDALAIGELHGKVTWAVKAIWHEYAGWFMYRSTTELYGVPRSAIDADIIELAGGAERLVDRAERHLEAGDPLRAIHLLDIVLGSGPGGARALKANRLAHQMLAERAGGENLSETMWLRAQIADADRQL